MKYSHIDFDKILINLLFRECYLVDIKLTIEINNTKTNSIVTVSLPDQSEFTITVVNLNSATSISVPTQ